MLKSSYDGRLTLLYLSSFEPRRPLAPTRTEVAVANAARGLGIDFVSTRAENERGLAPGLAPYGFPNSAFNQGHLNPDGHRIAGAVLARSLVSLRHRGLL